MKLAHTLTQEQAANHRVRRVGFTAAVLAELSDEDAGLIKCVQGLPEDATVERSYCHEGVFWLVVSSDTFEPVEPNERIPTIDVVMERADE